MEVIDHKPIILKLQDLKYDKTNPNEMSEDTMNALRTSMQKFGYLMPIIVDQNNKLADGEHRSKVYKEFNKTEIPAIRVKFKDDEERRMLRQAMNKIRGQHDLNRDYTELKILQKYNQQDLKTLLGVGDKEIQDLKKLIQVNERQGLIADPKLGTGEDEQMMDHYEDSFLHGNIKQIIIYLTNDEYKDIIPKLQKIMEVLKVDSHTELLKKLVDLFLQEKKEVKNERPSQTHRVQTSKAVKSARLR